MEKEALIKNFVGKKFDKLYNRNFSIGSLIFGWCYFVYRKMLLSGFGFLILQSAIISFFNILDKSIVIISYLLINLSLSLLFNSMYRNHVQKKVSIIMATAKNEEDAKNKSIKKGGTSFGLVFVSIIITIILTIIFNFIYGVIFIIDSAVDFVKDNVSINGESFENNTITILEGGGYSAFGGDEDLSEYITYKLDEKFKQDDIFENEYNYEDGDGLSNEVSVRIIGYKNIIFGEGVKEQFKEEKKTVNSKEWTIYKYDERDELTQVNENSEITEENEINNEEYDIKVLAVLPIKDLNIIIHYSIEEDVEDKEGALEEFNTILESVQYKE